MFHQRDVVQTSFLAGSTMIFILAVLGLGACIMFHTGLVLPPDMKYADRRDLIWPFWPLSVSLSLLFWLSLGWLRSATALKRIENTLASLTQPGPANVTPFYAVSRPRVAVAFIWPARLIMAGLILLLALRYSSS